MGTRSMTALDCLNNRTHTVARRAGPKASWFPHGPESPHQVPTSTSVIRLTAFAGDPGKLSLGDLQQTYVPAQPVLSSRTVNIDLPGTRTYRQKSTLDIIEEQQRLIRQLYTKPRVPQSAPPRVRTPQTARSLSESNIGKVNIEVKGRPLTSGTKVSATYKENSPVATHTRPKTAGPLKHVCPLTNCHREATEDRDLLAISQSSQKLRHKLHSYWKSELNTLAVGKFVRGQKFLDEALPNLDSWLTFGGAAGINNQGVIDAFASFKNSEEYYNIEGSVGNQVARQLQKGGKIRIGINGILQTQDFKVKKWNNNNVAEFKAAGMLRDSQQMVTKEGKDEPLTTCIESTTNPSSVKEMESAEDLIMLEERTEASELVNNVEADRNPPELLINVQTDRSPLQIEFGELVISPLHEFEEKVEEPQKAPTPVSVEMSVDTTPESSVPDDEAIRDSLRQVTPLSWNDQCSKANVKIIHANLLPKEISKPVMSETFPVKFQKLTDGAIRPKLVDIKSEGFKIKQRSTHESKNTRENSSKVKVVYIDPLTRTEDEMLKGLSVENIINHQLQRRNTVNSSILIAHDMTGQDKKSSNTNIEGNNSRQPRVKSTQSEMRSLLSTSSGSMYGEQGRMYSPKLKVTPVHSLAGHKGGNLRIMSADSGYPPKSKDTPRNGRTPRKFAPAKPLHRAGAGQGSSVTAGPLKGEPEYIKIISQLKITSSTAPSASQSNPVSVSSPAQLSAGRNSPDDLSLVVINNEAQPVRETAEAEATGDLNIALISNTSSSKSSPEPTEDSNGKAYDQLNEESCPEDGEFPADTTSPATVRSSTASASPAAIRTLTASIAGTFPTAAAISIPTAAAISIPTAAAISIPTADEEVPSHLLSQLRASVTFIDQNL